MKKRKYLLWIAVALLAAVAVFSAWQLIRYYSQIHQSQAEYDHLAQLVEQARPTEPVTEPADPSAPQQQASAPEQTAPTEPLLVEVTGPDGQTRLILPEYQPIYKLNCDLAGWICIDGTNINFPVLYKPDYTDYYLHRNFYGDYSNQGAIYIQENCDPFKPSDNVVIYGHRTNAGTMFAALQGYLEQSFWQAHPYIRFDSLTQHRSYEILAVFTIESTLDSDFLYHKFTDAADPAEFDAFLANCQRYALYDTGVQAQYGDKLITLSTCYGSNDTGRLVVVAKQVTE